MKVCSHCCKPEELRLEGGKTGWTSGHLESLQVCWVREATGATKNRQLLEPAPEVAFSEEGYPQSLSICTGPGLPSKGGPCSQPSQAPHGPRCQDPKEGRGPDCLDHSPKVNGSVGFPYLPSLPLLSSLIASTLMTRPPSRPSQGEEDSQGRGLKPRREQRTWCFNWR